MDALVVKFLELANDLIDRMVTVEGVHYTIRYLVDFGFTQDELISMNFLAEEIIEALVFGGNLYE